VGVKKCVAGFAGRKGLRGSLGMVEFGVAYAAAERERFVLARRT